MKHYLIMHKNSLCLTDEVPDEAPGIPCSIRMRSVVCQPHRQAGVLASEGYEDEVLHAWAVRNGYSVGEHDGVYALDLNPNQDQIGLHSNRRNR